MVGDLHDVGTQPFRVPQEQALRGRLRVAGQQEPAAVHGDRQDDGVRVVVTAEATVRRGAAHLDRGGAEGEALAGGDGHDRHAGGPGGRERLPVRRRDVVTVRLEGDGPDDERADVESRQHRR